MAKDVFAKAGHEVGHHELLNNHIFSERTSLHIYLRKGLESLLGASF